MATYGVPLVVIGVSGSGKTTVAKLVAERLDYRFFDADDFHPPENIAKMKAGIALDDEDRKPWLARLADLLAVSSRKGEPVVLACSALKRAYRERLASACEALLFVYLAGDPDVLFKRLSERKGHYMPASLLASQLEALEVPGRDENAIELDIAQTPEALVGKIGARLGRG